MTAPGPCWWRKSLVWEWVSGLAVSLARWLVCDIDRQNIGSRTVQTVGMMDSCE
jgi:hypothetical protein